MKRKEKAASGFFFFHGGEFFLVSTTMGVFAFIFDQHLRNGSILYNLWKSNVFILWIAERVVVVLVLIQYLFAEDEAEKEIHSHAWSIQRARQVNQSLLVRIASSLHQVQTPNKHGRRKTTPPFDTIDARACLAISIQLKVKTLGK